MIQLLSTNGTVSYGLYKFIIDSIEDLANLPERAKMGSEAIVTATSETYIKNGNGEWVIKNKILNRAGGDI